MLNEYVVNNMDRKEGCLEEYLHLEKGNLQFQNHNHLA